MKSNYLIISIIIFTFTALHHSSMYAQGNGCTILTATDATPITTGNCEGNGANCSGSVIVTTYPAGQVCGPAYDGGTGSGCKTQIVQGGDLSMQVMNCTESLTAQIYFADVAYYEKGIDDPDFPTAGAIGGGAGLALLNPADATAPCTQVADQDPAITQVPYEWDSTTGTCCIAPGQLLL